FIGFSSSSAVSAGRIRTLRDVDALRRFEEHRRSVSTGANSDGLVDLLSSSLITSDLALEMNGFLASVQFSQRFDTAVESSRCIRPTSAGLKVRLSAYIRSEALP